MVRKEGIKILILLYIDFFYLITSAKCLQPLNHDYSNHHKSIRWL
jgi:hypothetical protein